MTSTTSSARRRIWLDDAGTSPRTSHAAIDIPQYGLPRVLGTWAAAALPMGALAWLVAPRLAGELEGPSALARSLIAVLTLGLIWQFVLVIGLVRHEQGSLRWPVIKEALWLRAPRRPDGRRMGWAWLVLAPLLLAFALEDMLPGLPVPSGRDMGDFLESGKGQDFLSGNWAWLAIIVVLGVFNTALGEELLFRGLLLPRMNATFGKGDWVANGVLFAAYHLHMPWVIPTALLDAFILSYPTKRYRSAVMGIAVHSAQTMMISVLALLLVLR
jgi:membrane protease YdiL (CAAX protease family)